MRETSEPLTQNILRHLRRTYDPDTGLLLDYRGEPCGYTSQSKPGRWYMRVNLGRYGQHYVHRLAFLAMTGEWPQIVDHIDHDGLNNAWANLRSVTPSQNMWNLSVPADHKTGVRGVYYAPTRTRTPWVADLRGPGFRMCRYFPTFDAAVECRLEAQRVHWVY